jgi:hypothetical protein
MTNGPDLTEAATPEAPQKGMRWEIDVPLVTHPLMLAGYVKIFGLTGILMGIFLSFLMAVTGSLDAIPMVWMMSGGISAGLFVVGLLASALIYGNRMRMRFKLDADQAGAEIIDRRSKTVSIAAIVLGVLARKPGAVGAGLIGATDTERTAAWRGIVSAKFYPRHHAISLRNSWRTVIILFCSPANYERAAAFVRQAMTRNPTREGARTNPLPKLFLHTGLIFAAMLPFFLLDSPLKVELFAVIFTLCFALASLWLIPHLCFATFLGLGVMAAQIAASSMEQRRSMFSPGNLYRAYEVMSGDDWAQLALGGAGAAYLIWLSLGLLRGRINSGLAGDMAALEDDKSA